MDLRGKGWLSAVRGQPAFLCELCASAPLRDEFAEESTLQYFRCGFFRENVV